MSINPIKLVRKKEWNSLVEKATVQEKEISLASNFIQEIEKGNLESNELENKDQHTLTGLLMSMRNKMKSIAQEESERSWVNQGLAKFSDVLRSNHDDLNQLCNVIISELVKYLGANQGGLYLVNRNNLSDVHIELTAAYAYNRKKYISQRIELGEGMIGQAALEKDIVYMTDIPANFIKITSGLGEALPRNIIIVPLKVDDIVYGLIELASFQVIKKYQIQFLERLAETLASSIASVRTAEQTQNLLRETQQQAEQLRAQEEELRQNMEEISATQEALERQMKELNEVKRSLEERENVFTLTTILSESDLHGTITFVNDKFCQVARYSREELLGKGHNIVRHPDMPKELFKLFWQTIKAGKVFKGIVKNRAKDGSHYWVDATIVPIKDEKGNIIKYIGARYHIANEAMAIQLYNEQALNHGWPLLEEKALPLELADLFK